MAEDGRPVERANVAVGFERNGKEDAESEGLSDDNGYYRASANTNGHIGWTITKYGYYETRNVYDFKNETKERWEPWNPTIEVLLHKIINPVPMYARNTKYSTLEIPVVGKDVGFDLTKFDWVAPYGAGTQEDFIFHLKRRVVGRKDFDATLTIKFSNKYDGIQYCRENLDNGSLFKLPRYAPENGYQDRLVLKEWRHPGDYSVKRNFDFLADDMNYIFRIRTEDEDGQIDRAMYGKILGFIDFTAVHSETAKIYFKYYLNPDYTRNLEYDPERNLFGELPPLEKVGIR